MAARVVLTNQIGNRGEGAVKLQFMRPTYGTYDFEVNFLGEKAQLLDFRVALLDDRGKVFGPYFLVQAKTHAKRNGAVFPVGIQQSELERIRYALTPTFIAGIELGRSTETVWICAVTTQVSLPSIPKTHDLSNEATRRAIYNHVMNHFNRRTYAFKSTLT